MSIKDGVKKRFFNRVIEVSTSCTVRIAFEDIRLFKTAEFWGPLKRRNRQRFV